MFAKQLGKEPVIFSKIIDKLTGQHPDVHSYIHKKLHGSSPIVLKLTTEKAKELTNVDTVSYLREALQVAVELEMTVMFEYLFACFSVINSSDEVNPETPIEKGFTGLYAPYLSELRREYKNQFMIICVQEMKHMRMACDMLISIGGVPNLQNVKFPSKFGVDGEDADLIRLNLKSLFMFAKNEESYPDDSAHTEKMFVLQPEVETGFQFVSIAQLYGAISDGFKTVHSQVGDSMFCVKPEMVTMGGQPYTDLQSCLDSIHTIQEQGEGELGGVLFEDIIKKLIEFIKDIDMTGKDQSLVQLQQQIVLVGERILGEVNDLEKLLPNILKLIGLVKEFETKARIRLPFAKPEFINEELIEPSHWSRFLMMILNYLMLMKQVGVDMDSEQFSAYFSRPSCPRPSPEPLKYHPITQKVVDMTNTAFHVLLKILEATIISVPEELNTSKHITQRYNNIRFYPIMSILIYPLGEILSYFQLSPEGRKLTAGFPFIPITDEPSISDPLDKFHDIILTLYRLYKQSLKLDSEFFSSLDTCVGMWVADKIAKQQIVDRVKFMLTNVIESIKVLYLGFTSESKEMANKQSEQKLVENINKYYLNIEFEGFAIYSMATDNDPTFETRGFCGHQFMFEQTNDPDFNDELYTQNTLPTKDGNPFVREFVPERCYKGVKCTSAKLVLPYYESEDSINKDKFETIQNALLHEFRNRDFCFLPIEINGVQYRFRIPQLNYAVTRHIGLDPVNVRIETDHFTIQRPNLIYDAGDNVIDFVTACLTCSENYGAYPKIVDGRLPKSGGYLQWADPFHGKSGLLKDTNLMNSKCGAGQSPSDFYTTYKRRCDAIKVEIDSILKNQDPSIARLINLFLETFPQSKLIVLALMVSVPPPAINRLSYLCTRYLNCVELIKSHFIASKMQCFYHIPLNAPKGSEYFKAVTKQDGSPLSGVTFVEDQDWYLDLWVGGMDYDALTLFMTGSLMVPVTVDLGKP